MSYKFVKITSFYNGFLYKCYNCEPDLKNKSYIEQYNYIMGEKFAWADFFKKHLENLGNEAYEIIYNATYLQKAWAKENGVNENKDILLEQLKKIQPEVVFFQDSLTFNKDKIDEYRKKVPSIKKIIGWSCSPFNKIALETYKSFDFIFVCFPRFINEFQNEGIKVYEINHGFEVSILKDLEKEKEEKNLDLTFIGSLINSSDFHSERIKFFNNLVDSGINLKIYGNILDVSNSKIFLQRSNFYFCNFLKKLGLDSLAKSLPKINKSYNLNEPPKYSNFSDKLKKSFNKQQLFGLDMYKKLRNSAIGLNIHGGIAGDYAANMRMYEVTGVGSCLITDYKKNIGDFFDPDNEIVTFNNFEECQEKIKYLIQNPSEIERISKNGQKRVLEQHTLEQRIYKINEIILNELYNN